MADSKVSILKTLVHEGGFEDLPQDSGGPTKYGITQADLPGQDIADLTEEQAVAYYQETFWKPLYSQIAGQNLADKIFDCGVLFGVGTTIKYLQECLGLRPDGIFGPMSLSLANAETEYTILNCLKVKLMQHANDLVAKYPKNQIFLKGWLARVNS